METPWVHDIICHTITNFNYLRNIRGLTPKFFCFSFSFATTTALIKVESQSTRHAIKSCDGFTVVTGSVVTSWAYFLT